MSNGPPGRSPHHPSSSSRNSSSHRRYVTSQTRRVLDINTSSSTTTGATGAAGAAARGGGGGRYSLSTPNNQSSVNAVLWGSGGGVGGGGQHHDNRRISSGAPPYRHSLGGNGGGGGGNGGESSVHGRTMASPPLELDFGLDYNVGGGGGAGMGGGRSSLASHATSMSGGGNPPPMSSRSFGSTTYDDRDRFSFDTADAAGVGMASMAIPSSTTGGGGGGRSQRGGGRTHRLNALLRTHNASSSSSNPTTISSVGAAGSRWGGGAGAGGAGGGRDNRRRTSSTPTNANNATNESQLSNDSCSGGVLANAVPVPVHVPRDTPTSIAAESTHTTIQPRTTSTPTPTNTTTTTTPPFIHNPHASLRSLVSNAILTSPTSATLYASTLYTQTTLPSDAYLYAQALYAGGEAKRAVYLLDRAGLLSSSSESEQEDWTLLSRSVVLACQCLAVLSEWEDISTLVTDLFRSAASLVEHGGEGLHSQQAPHASSQDLHELDEELQQVWSLVRLGRPNSYTEIFPVAQLCTWKGRAVEEGGNPRRAAKWLRLALEVDWKCVESWMYLCERQLLTWEEEQDLILGLTRVIEQETKDIGNGETHQLTWLKDMYLARLSYWSGMQTNKVGLEKRGQEEGIQLEENAMNNDGNLRTPSVEEYRRRTRQTTTPDLRSPMISSILPEDGEHLDDHLLPGGGTPSMVSLMDASSIHYQPSPATSTPFDGTSPPLQESNDAGGSHPHNRHRGSPPSQAEQAFQNLLFKHDLAHSPEVLTLAATRAYNSYNLPLALEYCQTLYEMDPLCPMAAPIQIATLVGLGHKRPLFRLAHALVDADPKSAVAWHAVGCYYYTCGRYDMAQRHFCRATRIEPRNAEGWIAFGCAFAMCDENDQANACFRAAQRLHAGSHYPMLYMGMEHLRTNNIPLSGHFLKSARSMGKNDPLCCNELGVWAYRKGDFRDSIGWFVMALRLYVEADMAAKVVMEECLHDYNNDIEGTFGSVPKLRDRDCIDFCQESFWEPTIFNVGQSYRKERRFQEAIFCFEKCLALCPGNATSYSALGFTLHLVGDLDGAIESYHQALSRKPGDPFASDMLDRALVEALDQLKPPGGSYQESSENNFALTSSPLTIHKSSGMSMSANLSHVKYPAGDRGRASLLEDESSAFSLGDSDVDMSMS